MKGPTPCNHCGYHFMPHDMASEEHRLCNNCHLREIERNKKKEVKMYDDNIVILINCPKKDHAEIEEACINEGLTLSEFFIHLYSKYVKDEQKEPESSSENDVVSEAPRKAGRPKKS